MEIKTFDEAAIVASLTGSNAQKFNVAVNNIILPEPKKFSLYVNQQDGATDGALVGGTSSPIVNVHPAYFPVATKGAECAAIVTTLAWADANLFAGYEYFILEDKRDGTGKGAVAYFVSGILNSSQTQANDPFDPSKGGTGIVAGEGCCWAGDYTVGLNPFA